MFSSLVQEQPEGLGWTRHDDEAATTTACVVKNNNMNNNSNNQNNHHLLHQQHEEQLSKWQQEQRKQQQQEQQPLQLDPSHLQPLGTWSAQQLSETRDQHPFMMTWIPGKLRHSIPIMTHGKGTCADCQCRCLPFIDAFLPEKQS